MIDEDKDFKQESKRVSYDGPQIKSLQSYKSKSESIHQKQDNSKSKKSKQQDTPQKSPIQDEKGVT